MRYAKDHQGTVFDVLVQSRLDWYAAGQLMPNLFKRRGSAPQVLITEKLKRYAAASRHLVINNEHCSTRR